MLVRDATGDDVEAIREVGHRAWPPTYAFAGDEYVAHGLEAWWSPAAVLRSLRETRTVVAEVDDRVVGMGNLDLRTSPPTIWKLYVLPDQQAAGVGSALIAELIGKVPVSERSVVLEYTDGNDRAAGFYRRHGFHEVRREVAERPGWPTRVWAERHLERD